MEQFNHSVNVQAVSNDEVKDELIEQQLFEANKKIKDLESQLAWSLRAYE